MLTRLLAVAVVLCGVFSTRAFAVYFPSGIDWTNESQQRFVMSMYLNILGRAPESSELRSLAERLTRNDNSQARLDLFKQFLGSAEYRRLFPDSDESWRVYRAPDLNDNRGNNRWRYQAALKRPAGFENWELSGSSTLPVAQAMAAFYSAYCYAGIPCVQQADAAKRREDPLIANRQSALAHACADESELRASFEWIAFNGTTYPRGTDSNTLCMGDHYYRATGTLLQRYQCEAGYTNCRRDQSRDVRGERTGRDDNGKPALFFSDGSRLVLTEYDERGQSEKPPSTDPMLAASQHECADNAKITRYYQWRGPNGTTQSSGVGNNVVCMENYYYAIEGMTLKHYSCNREFTNCVANPSKDVVAQRRTRVDGKSALEFRNGTTLSLLDKAPTNTTIDLTGATGDSSRSTSNTVNTQATRRLAGQHECGVSTLRLSQFQWRKNDGSSLWPDGVNGETVCMDNAYYAIDGFVLRHYQCSGDFQNCRQSRGKDLIALREGKNANGLRTLTFANGDQLSLISR